MAARKVTFRGKAVTVACTDKARSERFYEKVLGARRLPSDGYGCPWFRLGDLTISLMPNAAERSPAAFPTHAMPVLTLEADDLSAAHRYLVRHAVPVVEWHEDTFLLVEDPDGLLIEIWQAEPADEDGPT